MRGQESSRKPPKCDCCELCVEVQRAKCEKNNSLPEKKSLQTTDDSFFKNFAIPDDLYNCEENINRVKSFNERALKILDDLRQRACRILENSECVGPSEDEEDVLEAQEQQIHQSRVQPNRSRQSPLQQQQHSRQHHQSHSHHNQSRPQQNQSHQSHLQQQPCSQQQHHQSHLQQQPYSQQHHQSPLQQQHHQSYLQPNQSHLQQQSYSQQQQHQSFLQQNQLHPQQRPQPCQSYPQKQLFHQQQQEQLHHQEQSKTNTRSKSKLRDAAPCARIQNLGYLPQSNFLKKMQRQAEINPNPTSNPLTECGCANCFPEGICHQPRITCRCCRRIVKPPLKMQTAVKLAKRLESHPNPTRGKTDKRSNFKSSETRESFKEIKEHSVSKISCFLRCLCNPIGHGLQRIPCCRFHIRERGPCSEISSMHDPCACFRTWRTSPCVGHFPEYQCDILEGEDDICADEAYIQECLSDRNDECEDKTRRKKKGKSGHVSRVDKKKRRSGRRKSKPSEKECSPPEIDFSPSLKRPHPGSCERCWRYASPSRSPVNKPSQRFDPNYRRSHSEVNVNSDSKGNVSKSGSRYSSTNCVDFDPETKVYEVMSPDRPLTRIKSADNVQKSGRLRPTSPKPCKRAPGTKDDAGKSRIKKEELAQQPNSKYQRSFSGSAEMSREILQNDRQNPMPCSPSMFDKKSQRSNSKKSASNRLSSSESCKENIKMEPRPTSACQIQAFEGCCDKPRAQSSDRNYFNKNMCIPPERMRRCYCTQPRTRTVNMNVMCEQPLFYQGGKDCFPEVGGPFGMSNNAENLFGYDKLCPGQGGWKPFCDMRPCLSCFNDSPRSKFGAESLTRCCCQGIPVTLCDAKIDPKDEGETVKKRNGERARNKNRKNEESNPRKYCVFYMNKSEENDKDGVEVLVEELTEGRNDKDSKREPVKNKAKRTQEPRSDSMALRFQKGIAEKCGRRGNNRVSYF